MNETAGKIHIVDDDDSFRRSLTRLLKAHGFACEAFDSARQFIEAGLADRAGCIILDVHMPGLNGLELQEALVRAKCTMPIIFLTGRGDIPTSVQAMKKGAADFLTKPVDEAVLLKAIEKAMQDNRRLNGERAQVEAVLARIRTLTEREHEVMRHVIAGALNKQTADELGTVEKTIKVHRARVMEKMEVESVAELVRLCAIAGVEPAGR